MDESLDDAIDPEDGENMKLYLESKILRSGGFRLLKNKKNVCVLI